MHDGVKKNEVLVKVIGMSGSGKTTVARELEKVLKAHGFDVEYTDSDGTDPDFFTDARARRVGECTKVRIDEVRLRFNSLSGCDESLLELSSEAEQRLLARLGRV